MAIVIKGNIHLTQLLNIHKNTANLVVLGNLSSTEKISFKVKNLIVIGKIFSDKDFCCVANADLFNVGTIEAENVKIKASSTHNGLSPIVLQKINALGIEGLKLDQSGFSFQKPKTTESKK